MTPRVCIVKVASPIDMRTFHYLLQFAPPEKQERILHQRVKQNADNMAVGAALATYMLYLAFCIPPSELHIAYGFHGKPYLSGNPNVHFSISHSGTFVACGVCDTPIGVDIQMIDIYKDDVAKRVCSPEELLQIETNSDPAAEFTKIWVQKEAYLKMTGFGLCENMEAVSTAKIPITRVENAFLAVAMDRTMPTLQHDLWKRF